MSVDNVKLLLPNASFSGDNAFTLEKVDKFPCALPRDALPKFHTVVDRTKVAKEKEWCKHDLKTNIHPAPLTERQKYRELLANWFDQVARSNGSDMQPSFKAVHFLRGFRENGKHTEEVIVAYNKDKGIKLSEIVFCRSMRRLHFINYGAYIRDIDQVIATGRSNKVGVDQQGGANGEGVKRAIATMLEKGFHFNIKLAVLRNGDMCFSSWRFHENTSSGTVACDERFPLVRDNQRLLDGPCDLHRFEVIIEGEKPFVFDLFSYIVPRMEFIRDKTGDSDHGDVILDPEERGSLYVWYFKICTKEAQELRYAYSLFMPKIERDRSNIDRSDLIWPIANIWNTAILKSDEMATLFYETILIKPQESVMIDGCRVYENYVEWSAVYSLSNKAKQKLANIFKERNKDAIPVNEDMLKMRPSIRERKLIEVPKRATDVFYVDASLDLDKLTEYHKKILIDSQSPLVAFQDMSNYFKSYCKVRFGAALPQNILPYAYDDKNNTIVINSMHYEKQTRDEMFAELACIIVPRVFEDIGKPYVPVGAFAVMKEEYVKLATTSAPAAAAAAKPPPPPPPHTGTQFKTGSARPVSPPKRARDPFAVPDGYVQVKSDDVIILKKKK